MRINDITFDKIISMAVNKDLNKYLLRTKAGEMLDYDEILGIKINKAFEDFCKSLNITYVTGQAFIILIGHNKKVKFKSTYQYTNSSKPNLYIDFNKVEVL